ncbi:MAG: BMP family ABC transporter substrate-binding protein [Candidatus Limnocylindria bacterium]
MQRRYVGVATLITVMLVLAACQGGTIDVGKALCREVGDATATQPSPPEASGTSDAKIGLVTDVGTLDDKNFNEYSWLGAQQGATAIGAEDPRAIVTTASADYETNIQTLIDEDYSLIVTVGFALGAATLTAATDNPDVHFVGVDQFQANDPLDNYESLIFNEAQAGYLAGIVAASITQSDQIAAIGGSGTIPPVVNYMRGYENGAKSVNADITVHLKYISDDLAVAFNDPITGKSFSDQFLSQNGDVDVMFQVAGKTGNGVLESAEAAGIYAIGVDVDQWQSTSAQAECIVTSAEKKLTKAVSDAIIAFGGGEPRTSNVFYGADNDGIGLAPYYQFDGNVITDEIKTAVTEAFDSMADLDLDPCQPSNLCYAGEADPGT